jgi:hypothetical protein
VLAYASGFGSCAGAPNNPEAGAAAGGGAPGSPGVAVATHHARPMQHQSLACHVPGPAARLGSRPCVRTWPGGAEGAQGRGWGGAAKGEEPRGLGCGREGGGWVVKGGGGREGEGEARERGSDARTGLGKRVLGGLGRGGCRVTRTRQG